MFTPDIKFLLERLEEARRVQERAQANQRLMASNRFLTEYAEDEPEMPAELREAWRHFLKTNEAGKVLERLANWQEQQTNRAAVHRTSGVEQNVGYARGWHDCTVYFFKTLSAKVQPQSDPDTQTPNDAASLRERMAS